MGILCFSPSVNTYAFRGGSLKTIGNPRETHYIIALHPVRFPRIRLKGIGSCNSLSLCITHIFRCVFIPTCRSIQWYHKYFFLRFEFDMKYTLDQFPHFLDSEKMYLFIRNSNNNNNDIFYYLITKLFFRLDNIIKTFFQYPI